ncbi:MAG: metallophosphoesterase family protein [Hyphomicrobium sp.]|nr:metallophosphoesterase family protein [Hyphomicrobium sp.]
MRTIAHISDLHFGRINPLLPPALRAALLQAQPDVVVVSGDLTQRARRAEFVQARAFLDTLPFPQVVVPGNHDVPLHDVMRRWLAPLEKYRHFIGSDIEPFYADEEVIIQGLSTARSLTWKNGRINRVQVERTCTKLAGTGPDVTRIVVTHHPFDLPGEKHDGSLVGRAEMAITAFTKCRVDMILSGHFHIGHAGNWGQRHSALGHAAILVQAGTATSTRQREEANSWNLIRIDRPDVTIERQTWDPEREGFATTLRDTFQLGEGGWLPAPPSALSTVRAS